MIRRVALAALALVAGCAGPSAMQEPTSIAMTLSRGGPVEASARIESLDRKPAWARLYVVPAAYADQASAAIRSNGGQLGRWALFPIVSISMDGQAPSPIQLGAAGPNLHRGDLLILAIDPISRGRFAVSGAQIIEGAK